MRLAMPDMNLLTAAPSGDLPFVIARSAATTRSRSALRSQRHLFNAVETVIAAASPRPVLGGLKGDGSGFPSGA
jgi:hypothetical protein